MKLATLHKRLAMQSMNPKDKLAEEKAKAIGHNVNGKFVSFYDSVKQIYGKRTKKRTTKRTPAPVSQDSSVPAPKRQRKKRDVVSNSGRARSTSGTQKKTHRSNARMGNT